MKKLLLSIIGLLPFVNLTDQFPFQQKLEEAAHHRPLEKLYLHTDHAQYKAGDLVWFKAYLSDDLYELCGNTSSNIYVELLNPRGQLVGQSILQCANGQMADAINLPNAGGIYTLKAYTDYLKSFDKKAVFEKKLTVQSVVKTKFQMTLEVDKTHYTPGERVLAKMEAYSTDNQPIANTEVDIRAVFDGKNVFQKKIKTDDQGRWNMAFFLPNDLPLKNGLLTAAITHNGVSETIACAIPMESKEVELSFFPEGGNLVAGFNNRIAFEAMDSLDNPVDCSGFLFNENGERLTAIGSYHKGMGAFELQPNNNKKYYVQLNGQDKKFYLPKAMKTGTALRINNGEKVAIGSDQSLKATFFTNQKATWTAVLRKGETLVSQTKITTTPGANELEIPIEETTPGILQLTLFDAQNRPIAERLVFANRDLQLNIRMQTDKEKYLPGEEVNMTFYVSDEQGQPVDGNFSLTVLEDRSWKSINDKQDNILSRLFLTSELKGNIEDPAFYFDKKETKAAHALDLLMMTHGWRRYAWEEVLENEFAGQSLMNNADEYITGRVSMSNGKVLKNHRVWIAGTDKEAYTDENGRFKINVAGTELPVKVKTKYKGHAGERLCQYLNSPAPKTLARYKSNNDLSFNLRTLESEKLQEVEVAVAKPSMASSKDMVAAVSLDEVVITGFGVVSNKKLLGYAVSIVENSNAQSDVFMGIGDDLNMGIMVDRNNLGPHIYQDYNYNQHRHRRQFRQRKTYPNTTRNNFNKTVFWQPEIKTKEGKAAVKFWASDEISTFRMVLEGISNGIGPGRSEQTYFTQLPLSMEVFAPDKITYGDSLVADVWATNQTNEDVTATLNVTTYAGHRTGNGDRFDQYVNIPAGQRVLVPVPIKAGLQQGRRRISFQLKGGKYFDQNTQDLTISPKGFPKEVYESGKINEKTFTFQVDEYLPKTLSASLSAYPHPIAEIADGVSSILREPHGCFEQVSSSNYPNILAMQVLQGQQLVDFDLQKKSLGYLKNGYKKLSAYEVAGGGFSLYGRSPASLRLTAYGLLQFRDMQKVWDGVSEKMIDRTVKWILKNKGQKQNIRYYKSYLTDVFTLYVLSEMYKDDHPQINSVLGQELLNDMSLMDDKALDSNDPYYVSMIACTNLNFGRPNAEIQIGHLLDLLKKQQAGQFKVKQTFALSYGKSQQVETAAWAALALLKAKKHHSPAFEKLMMYLHQSKNNYGGFGSTQATVMALKVIHLLSQTVEEIKGKGEVIVQVNNFRDTLQYDENSVLKMSVDLTDHFVVGNNSISISQSNKNQLIPLTMQANWRTLSAPSAKNTPLKLTNELSKNEMALGDFVKYNIELKNTSNSDVHNPMAVIGLPAGLGLQSWQLKDLEKEKVFEYFEVTDNYLIGYFDHFSSGETKSFSLDLKAEAAGSFRAPASVAYPYYTDELKHWVAGEAIVVGRD